MTHKSINEYNNDLRKRMQLQKEAEEAEKAVKEFVDALVSALEAAQPTEEKCAECDADDCEHRLAPFRGAQ